MSTLTGSNDNELPPAGGLLLAAAGFEGVYVYGFHDDRWYLTADGVEYMIIKQDDGGLKLVENPF